MRNVNPGALCIFFIFYAGGSHVFLGVFSFLQQKGPFRLIAGYTIFTFSKQLPIIENLSLIYLSSFYSISILLNFLYVQEFLLSFTRSFLNSKVDKRYRIFSINAPRPRAVCERGTSNVLVQPRQTVPESLRMIITDNYSIIHSTYILQSKQNAKNNLNTRKYGKS